VNATVNCASCGNAVKKRRPWHRYCSPACRRRGWERSNSATSNGCDRNPRAADSLTPGNRDQDSTYFSALQRQPLDPLRPCINCGPSLFGWLIGSDTIVYAVYEPSRPERMAAYFIVPIHTEDGTKGSL
jgi:hypothetical protein